jgi:hypothetical protein
MRTRSFVAIAVAFAVGGGLAARDAFDRFRQGAVELPPPGIGVVQRTAAEAPILIAVHDMDVVVQNSK